MAERDSWATMNGSTRVVDAEDARLAVGALWTPGASAIRARQGIRPATGTPGKVSVSGTPDKNVTVKKFQATVTASRGSGEYVATLDADKTLDLLTANPMGALPRWDLIVAVQTDTYYGDGSTAFVVRQVVGTPNASPSDPNVTAVTGAVDYIVLERIKFPASAATVQDSYLDHLSSALTFSVGLGGLLPVYSVTERNALSAYDGLPIYRMDRDWVEIYDGTAWRVQKVAVCSSTADRDSAITSPYDGLLAVTTDTRTLWLRQSGAWRLLSGGVTVARHTRETASTTTTSSTGIGVVSGSVSMLAGHRYRVALPVCHVTSDTNGDGTMAKITHTTDGSAPTASSPIVKGAQSFGAAHPSAPVTVVGYITPGSDVTFRYLVCVARYSGSGNSSIYADGTRVLDVEIVDTTSIDPGNSGTNV